MDEQQLLPSMRLEHLTFTGPGLIPANLRFEKGLNIFYGGSNAGKSYTLEVINFMLGGDTPAILDHGRAYDTVLLGVAFSNGNSITLQRARRGGGIKVYEGLSEDGVLTGRSGRALSVKHGAGKDGSISELLLEMIGIMGASVAGTEAGALAPFSMRFFVPYLLIDEGRMFSTTSPTVISPKNGPTLNKNVLRFIVTGQDDSDIITVPNEAALKASNSGKLELLSEMILDLDRKLEGVIVDELEGSRERLANRLEAIGENLTKVQEQLDINLKLRRDVLDKKFNTEAHVGQLRAMEVRFLELKDTYLTDIRRLEAIEEGGFLLQRFEDQPCPMCGAQPGDQHQAHELGDIDRQHASAKAEINKIRRDLTNLSSALTSVMAEADGLDGRIASLECDVKRLDQKIEALRPSEASMRSSYRQAFESLEAADRTADLLLRREALLAKKEAISAIKVGHQRADGLTIGIDGPTGHKLAQTIKEVLDAWEYPNVEAVTWDPRTSDIAINGRPRGQNGKGVKAIFHSAFVVGLMLYCRRNNLPHPGFLVLDSPLVTYRKPIHFKRHGELEADEKAVAQTQLDQKFYEHLASLDDLCQVIVIENNDPPSSIFDIANVEMFTGESGSGRQGLFPV